MKDNHRYINAAFDRCIDTMTRLILKYGKLDVDCAPGLEFFPILSH